MYYVVTQKYVPLVHQLDIFSEVKKWDFTSVGSRFQHVLELFYVNSVMLILCTEMSHFILSSRG